MVWEQRGVGLSKVSGFFKTMFLALHILLPVKLQEFYITILSSRILCLCLTSSCVNSLLSFVLESALSFEFDGIKDLREKGISCHNRP